MSLHIDYLYYVKLSFRQEATQTVSPIEATVKSFDKRHLGTKFYVSKCYHFFCMSTNVTMPLMQVYEMEVKSSNSVFMIYRR